MDTVFASIVIKKLDLIIKGHHILNEVDFQAKTGEITLIYGPSGSGKTTLLNVINFLYCPASGEEGINTRVLQYSMQDKGGYG